MSRGTYLEINLKAVKENALLLHQLESKALMAIVKANAYGLGSKAIASALEPLSYVSIFGVATLKEAIKLRVAGIKKDIFILGAISREDINLVKENNLIINLYHEQFYHSLNDHDKEGLRVHLKVDTGMNRLGFKKIDAIKDVLKDQLLSIEGIFTHYATSDEDNSFIEVQFECFKSILKALNYDFKWIHASNSGASLHFKDDLTNMIRPGLALYGEDPRMQETLHHVVSLYSTIIAIQKIEVDETVGYNRDFKASESSNIGILPIGYADGFLRSNQGGLVAIDKKTYPIVGHICMDQSFILIDDDVKVGSRVELFGKHITLNEVAKRNHSISYEVLSILLPRIDRLYIGGKA